MNSHIHLRTIVYLPFRTDETGIVFDLTSNTSDEGTFVQADLSSKGLTSLPSALFGQTQIQILILDDNKLESIPPEVSTRTLQMMKFVFLFGDDCLLQGYPN